MSNKNNENEIIYRRLLIVLFFKFIGFFIILSKLFKLQIIEYFYYKKLSSNNSERIKYLLPKRGNILDRNGNSFTFSSTSKKVIYNYNKSDNLNDILSKVFNLLEKKPKDVETFIKKARKNIAKNPKQPVVLKRNLTRKEIFNLEYNLFYLSNIDIVENITRYYDLDFRAFHVVGTVGKIGENELLKIKDNNRRKMIENYDFKIGITGLEKKHNEILEGEYGREKMNIDAFGNIINIQEIEKPNHGIDIQVTLDKNLQIFTAEAMKDMNGGISVMNIKNGEILAMYSNPSIDANIFSRGLDDDEWNDIVSKHKENLLFNKNIALTYPPGSIFKLVVCIVALKNGIRHEMTVNCNGEYKIKNRVFHCWKKHGHGLMNMVNAISNSCGCYFYHLSTLLNIDDIYETAIELGLNQKYNIGLEFEKIGIIPNKNWKKKYFKENWQPGDNANACIGQGFVQVTLLQLLILTARIATGKKVTPNLLCNKDSNTIPFENLNIDESVLQIVREGMFKVVNEYGTAARHKKLLENNIKAAGKTGSAQIISKTIDDKEEHSVKKEMKGHGLFTCYAPFEDPKIAVIIAVEHGFAGSRSAEIALKVLNEALKLKIE